MGNMRPDDTANLLPGETSIGPTEGQAAGVVGAEPMSVAASVLIPRRMARRLHLMSAITNEMGSSGASRDRSQHQEAVLEREYVRLRHNLWHPG